MFVTQSHEGVFPTASIGWSLGANIFVSVFGRELAPGESRQHVCSPIKTVNQNLFLGVSQ